ncbi:MAG: hypothetical protein LBT48_00865 [Prevotellaceae bacterium]|jgi:hypothetical protein|nr:hypothetical protein [Prevotellaceae bacterium]
MKKFILITLLFTPLCIFAQQDAYFGDFCKTFTRFNDELLTYRETSSNPSSDKAFDSFAGIMQQYRTMLKIYDEASFKYRHDTAFDLMLRPEYVKVLDEAEVLLEADSPLRSLKDMIYTMVRIECDGFPHTDREVEASLRSLRVAKTYRPEFFTNTMEGILLKKQIAGLEAYIFRKHFYKRITRLNTLPVTDDLRDEARQLKERIRTSACTPCRDSASVALLNFYRRDNENR